MKKTYAGKIINRSYSDKIFDVVNTTIMIVLLFIFAWPLWFVFIASFSDPNEVWLGNVVLWPKGFTMESYKALWEYKSIWTGYANTIFYTVIGTVFNLIMTVCAAYPLSRTDFVPRKFFQWMFMFTMYFGGGLIPTYLVVSELCIVNTRWAMIIPGAMSVYNMLVVRNYFMNSIPPSLQEAATLDGANSVQYLLKIVLPLSKPVIAVIALYYAVGHWNDFYTALVYLYDEKLLPLQTFLRDMLMSSKMTMNNLSGMDPETVARKMRIAQTLKYSAIIVSTVPVLCIYPFIQKYFVKGVMIGAVKG